jgi:Uma2 family endonuclease
MVAKPILVTADEFATLPEQLEPMELIGGEIIVSPVPTRKHQKITGRLYKFLDDIASERGIGEWIQSPTEVYIAERDVYQPDLVLFGFDAMPDNGSRAAEEIPLIVLEVLSPSTRAQDLVRKLPNYAKRGIGECWIVDAYTHSIAIHTLDMSGNIFETPVIDGVVPVGLYAGIRLPMQRIFAGFDANSWR